MGARCKNHFPAATVQLQRKVGILGESVIADRSCIFKRLPAESAESSRCHNNTSKKILGPAVDLKSACVLKVLKLPKPVASISNPDVSGNGAHCGVREWSDKFSEPIRGHHRVSVDHYECAVTCFIESPAKRGCLSGVGLTDETHTWLSRADLRDHLCGMIP